MKEGNRIVEYDHIKGLLIFLVVWGHFIQFVGIEVNNPIHVWIYSFHMPLFMFISGYFSLKLYNRTITSFLVKQISHLILPNFIWATLALLVLVPTCFKTFVWSLGKLITLYTDFWFLWDAFLCSAIYYSCCKVSYRYRYVLSFFIAILIFFFLIYFPPPILRNCSLSFFVTMLPYMFPIYVLGIFYKDYKNRIDKYVVTLIFLSAIVYLGILYHVLVCHYSISNIQVSLRLCLYITGCVSFLGFLFYIFRHVNCHFVRLNLIGQQTLGIYIVQHILFYWIFQQYSGGGGILGL